VNNTDKTKAAGVSFLKVSLDCRSYITRGNVVQVEDISDRYLNRLTERVLCHRFLD
jgi:hypothetical protein